MQEVFPECLWRFVEVTQTNQLLKGVKGEFSALGNKHTCRLFLLSADMHVRASAVIFSLQSFYQVVHCLLGLVLTGLRSSLDCQL